MAESRAGLDEVILQIGIVADVVDLGAFVELVSLLQRCFDDLGEGLGSDDAESVCLWCRSHGVGLRDWPSCHCAIMARDGQALALTRVGDRGTYSDLVDTDII